MWIPSHSQRTSGALTLPKSASQPTSNKEVQHKALIQSLIYFLIFVSCFEKKSLCNSNRVTNPDSKFYNCFRSSVWTSIRIERTSFHIINCVPVEEEGNNSYFYKNLKKFFFGAAKQKKPTSFMIFLLSGGMIQAIIASMSPRLTWEGRKREREREKRVTCHINPLKVRIGCSQMALFFNEIFF